MRKRSLLLPFLLSLFAITTAWSQGTPITVTGTVKDKSGSAIPDITVTEKGKSNSVLTDASGSFRIAVADRNAVLVFTGINVESIESAVGDQPLLIRLDQRSRSMEEVTVVGYSSKKREQISSAVSTVSGERFSGLP